MLTVEEKKLYTRYKQIIHSTQFHFHSFFSEKSFINLSLMLCLLITIIRYKEKTL